MAGSVNHEAVSKFDNSYVEALADVCYLSVGADKFLQYITRQTICTPDQYMDTIYEKYSTESIQHGLRTLLAILPTFVGLCLARIAVHSEPAHATRRFLIEFALIAVPVVIFINASSVYSDLFVAASGSFLAIYAWHRKALEKAKFRKFELGKRPALLTLLRATAYINTAVSILAIDFKAFPREFRKSRRFGASLMDVGIGIFVATMGMVSRRTRTFADFRRLAVVVSPLLVLGLSRTLVLQLIDYSQDEHEYGQHLNAFFTLGLTKLLGGLLSAVAHTDALLTPLAIALLAVHEILLQCGISDYVMDDYVIRDTVLNANREGICSLPGFVALYLLSISFTSWIREKASLSYGEMVRKLQKMTAITFVYWMLTFAGAYTIGIARVTCNFSYVVWVFAIVLTMMTLYMLAFDFVLNTALPLGDEEPPPSIELFEERVELLHTVPDTIAPKVMQPAAPVFAEALNMNGLVYFLLANILTGSVNIYLNPDSRNAVEAVIILVIYMLLSTGFVYVLYRNRIRIA